MFKIRTYPHFDAALTEEDAEALVSDPTRIGKHAFHPFIEYPERWTKFSAKGLKGKVKARPIMYASRRDGCIYAHYRSMLSAAYESELMGRSLSTAVIAYRRIPRSGSRGNKCNIHFAAEAFSEISVLGDCLVYALDISKFFENINHRKLKQLWMQIMGFQTMPLDHYRVFRSITRYASVRREMLYRALGFIGPKSVGTRRVIGYLVNRVPLQVCSGKDFREKIERLISWNPNSHGIPQGSPISDVLANLYMLEFDTVIAQEMSKIGGTYRRYSDDILLIVPGHTDDYHARLAGVEALFTGCGSSLQIQPSKSTVHKFSSLQHCTLQGCQRIHGNSGKNGLEYLGFRFDGSRVYIRDSTRSRLQRKMTFAVNTAVRSLHLANPGMGRAALKNQFNPDLVVHKFYKVRDFETVASIPKKWTFWTYTTRAQEVFGSMGKPIARQLRNFRRSVSHKAASLIDKCVNLP